MKSKKTINDAVNWYSEKRPVYEQLSKKIESIVQEIINDQKVHIHAISSRTKEIDSFKKKIEDPKYTDPINQITDYSGIRIITYVESDLELVCKVLEANFDIDIENSIDKSKTLGVDKVGYRSIHYICKLLSNRIKLPEYKKFNSMCFEIQVRTILQHGWSEVEHDKDYKFSGELPLHLKRRFKILAGVLELADREFNEIAHEIDKYSASVKADTEKGNFDILIDSTSVKSYLELKFDTLIKRGMKPAFFDDNYEKAVLAEMKIFGINTLEDLDDIIPKDLVEKVLLYYEFATETERLNYAGLLRNIMIIVDIEKYFNLCWQHSWIGLNNNTLELIKSYEVPIEEYVKKLEITVGEYQKK